MSQLEHFLSCPSCGEEVKSLPAYRGNSEFPKGYWTDGDTGKCHCGTECCVVADGESAWLETVGEAEDKPRD